MQKKNTKKQNYRPGKFPNLWRFLVKLHAENPDAFRDDMLLKAHVSQVWGALKDPTHCANCGESMAEYTYKLDFLNALLVKEMGDVIKKRMAGGMSLQEANSIHVVSQEFHDCVRHRTTQCRMLGLIAKVKTDRGTHDRNKGWLITARGFAALRGDRIPYEVVVFRNQIEERSDATTTLDDVFADYKGQNRDLLGERNPMDWVELHGYNQGNLL